jgi:hypothetical protein
MTDEQKPSTPAAPVVVPTPTPTPTPAPAPVVAPPVVAPTPPAPPVVDPKDQQIKSLQDKQQVEDHDLKVYKALYTELLNFSTPHMSKGALLVWQEKYAAIMKATK